MLPRGSGALLHVVSLPGGHGIGDLGDDADRFVDWLVGAGQRMWQVLPLGPTGYGNSPYASSSAFAGNPDLLSLDRLREEGLLRSEELEHDLPSRVVDYERVHAFKQRALREAAGRFRPDAGFEAFTEQAAYWLEDYVAVQSRGDRDEAHFLRFVQYEFERQWTALRRYANERQVRIVGDVPIFVADGSVDVRAHPDLFCLDGDQRPIEVAGVPPDLFSQTGQRWGNPLYRWEAMAADGYRWWGERLRRALELVDVVRIDHFRGFAAYWAVPASESTAVHGRWKKGPGTDLFLRLERTMGRLPIVVEDLGLITSDVLGLRDELGFPGMKVLQFAFDGKPDNPYLPHNYTPDFLVYTGTHDNDTTVGWYRQLPEADKHQVRRYLGSDASDVAWDLIRLAQASVARAAIFPVQDLLSLDSDARLNFPGRANGNWGWRLVPGQLGEQPAARLRDLTELYRRLPVQGEQPAPAPVKDYPFGVSAINSGL